MGEGFGRVILYVFLTAAVLGVIAILTPKHEPAAKVETTVAQSPAARDQPPKSKRHDLAQDSDYRHSHKSGFEAVYRLFRYHGLYCPNITHMWDDGIGPYGRKYEILCGPPGTADAYTKLHFALYADQRRISVCPEFGTTWGNDCE